MKQVSSGHRFWLRLLSAVLLCLPFGVAAQDEYSEGYADEDDLGDMTLPGFYVGPLGGYVSPDSRRDADYGINSHLIIGIVIADSFAIELNGFHTETNRDSDGRNDYSYGGGIDVTLGTPEPGSPIFMIGGGAIREDLRTARPLGTPAAPVPPAGYEDTSPYANAGLGFYLPFSIAGELWRLEARYNAVFNDEAIPGEDILEDGRFNLGFLFAFGREQLGRDEPPPAYTPPPPPAAPPAALDSDFDGVPDNIDQCPGTPRWVRADAGGCTPDTDGDGVDNTKDCCPQTPPGTAVDDKGCDRAAAAAAAAMPPSATDTDGDGVPDGIDECPHTVGGYTVNSKGCVNVAEVVMKNVHFELDKDALTADAYLILNSVSASLKQSGAKFEIAGHADASGGPEYNQELSARRANTVRDFLLYTGVPSDRLTAAAYGESQPLASNDTEEGRSKNRRVEFKPK